MKVIPQRPHEGLAGSQLDRPHVNPAEHLPPPLRLGLHVQDFASTGSESYVNLPEPTTGGLIGLGLLLATVRGRRR